MPNNTIENAFKFEEIAVLADFLLTGGKYVVTPQ